MAHLLRNIDNLYDYIDSKINALILIEEVAQAKKMKVSS